MAIVLNALVSGGAALSAFPHLETNGTDYAPAQAVSNHCAIVADPLGGNFNCVKLSLLASDALTYAGKRTELARNAGDDAINSEYWYYCPFLIPADWLFTPGTNYLVIQVHNTPDAGDTAVCGPPIGILLNGDGKIKVEISWDAAASTTSCTASQTAVHMCSWDAQPGTWEELVIRVKWAFNNTGIIQIFRDRRLVFSRLNLPNCYNDTVGNYFKFGPYGPFSGVSTDRHIYYKGLKVGDSNSSFAEVTGTTQLETVSAVNAALL